MGIRYAEGTAPNSCLGTARYTSRDVRNKGENSEENALPVQLCATGPDPNPAAPDKTKSWLCNPQISCG